MKNSLNINTSILCACSVVTPSAGGDVLFIFMKELIPRTSGVYKIYFLSSTKVYVGSTKNLYKRRATHFGRLKTGKSTSPKLQLAFNQYGEKEFQFEVLELCDLSVIWEKEKFYIDKYNSIEDGYNTSSSTRYPMLGHAHTEESKAKISKSNIGNHGRSGFKLTDEHKRMIGLGNTGKHTSRNVGAKQACAKLNDETAKRVKILLKEGNLSQAKIGAIFGICQQTVNMIKRGLKWKHITVE